MAGLTRKSLLLAKVQTESGSPATPTPQLNAILIGEPRISVDGRVLTRDFLRASLSRLPHQMGRKIFQVDFATEWKGSFALGVRPETSPLWRMAGFQETRNATLLSIRTAALRWIESAVGTDVYYVELVAGGDPSLANPDTVLEGGASGDDMTRGGSIAALRAGQFQYGDADTLGFSTVYVRLSDGADPDSKADGFVQHVDAGVSVVHSPRDSGHEFGTVYVYKDGILVPLTDVIADYDIDAQAGEFASISWRLRGRYVTPTDVPIPTTAANYHANLPPVCESMALTSGGFATGVIQSLQITGGVQQGERPDLNSPEGIKGFKYTGRAMGGSFNPEVELEATHSFWSRFENATEMALSANLGSSPNRIQIAAPSVQYGNISFADRNGNQAYQVPLFFNEEVSTAEKEITVTYN